jgi:hypothetical protein
MCDGSNPIKNFFTEATRFDIPRLLKKREQQKRQDIQERAGEEANRIDMNQFTTEEIREM